MKIGAFSQKYGLSVHAIRFYISKGLLVPEALHSQYQFNAADSKDMEMIQALKQCGFSLAEVHQIISLYRISGFASIEDVTQFNNICLTRREAIKQKQQQATAAIVQLHLLLGELDDDEI